MTLPMVTCPLCCQPGFSSSDSLCSALINVTTRKLCCPICNYVVVGLDKFTIHLFSHSLNKYGMEHMKDSVLLCQSNNSSSVSSRSISCSNSNIEAESAISSPNVCKSLIKLQHNADKDSDINTMDKQEWKMDTNNQNMLHKSLNIPDSSLICFRSDNGQLFTISTDGVGTTLKNVTINTQNYITNTNITTSSVQTSMTEKIQKRKYCQVFENDHVEEGSVFEQKSPDAESINSWPSTPSVLSESEKQMGINYPEREFESCKDLLTKGDFSTLSDDVNETDLKKDSCSSKIETEEILKIHEKKNNLIKKDCLNCELCPYTFPNKTILAMHKQLIHKKVDVDIENKQNLLLCNLCPRTFNLRSSLMIHQRVAHAGGFGNSDSDNSKQLHTKPACNICGKFFKKEIHLSQHMKAHDEKQWQCTICSKTFTTKYFLKKHRRLHTGETPYKCNTCSKSFTFQQSYHKHLLYHNDEKPYCCAQCGRLFKELSTLHNHERIHSGEKPFTCETCGKAFRQRVSYLVHRRIHTGAMPYQCTACNKRFRYKISQRTHKCSVNPPGIVVRTNGYLVERLQAAMIKASGESDNKTRQSEIDEKLLSHSQISSESASIKSDISTNLQNNCIASSDLVNNKANGNFSKTVDLEKHGSEKPQIYLLVKGPNEETYYQPILLSQNNNLIINQNTFAQPSEKLDIKFLKSKPLEQNLNSENQCVNLEMNVREVCMDSVDTNPNLHDEGVQSLPKTVKKEKRNDNIKIINEKFDDCRIIKNSPHWVTNDKTDNDQLIHETSEGSTNILSDECEMNDIIRTLTSQLSEEQFCPEASIQKENNLKVETNGDIVTMDSNDIFSLILRSSHSSPSERLGRLSISPITIAEQALANTNFDPAETLPNNSSDGQPDSLFDSINDDTLKELLFGSSE